jgi:hypothetical protein
MAKFYKIISILAFILALLFFLYGLYGGNSPNVNNISHTTKNVIYLDKNNNVIPQEDRPEVINLCESGRWKTLDVIVGGREAMINNKELFTQYPTVIEKYGRHKNQESISLAGFFNNNSSIQLKACDGELMDYSQQQVQDKGLSFVLNSKGALKLIEHQTDKLKVVNKYFYSITQK